MSDTEKAVSEFLTRNGYVYNVTNHGERNLDGWQCDAWLCRFTKQGGQEEFEFYTGIGHRTKPKADWMKPRAVAPPAASVLHSIILDSRAIGQSFESWCADFGYDTDSRKAESVYRECQQNADKLARVFSRADIAALENMLQDY